MARQRKLPREVRLRCAQSALILRSALLRASRRMGRPLSSGAFVYILRCADGRYYTGTARGELERRVAEHNAGTYAGFTAKRRPVTLVFSQWFDRITDAIAAEQRIKGWSRAKKEALIDGDFERLRLLSKRKR
jgi:putative endonuclease